MNLYETKLTKLPANSKKVFTGKIYEVFQWEQKMFDGSKQIFERALRPDAAGIIPILENGNILLNYEEQPSDQFEGVKRVHVPGGRIEGDIENPSEGAVRELKEETGIIPKKLYFITSEDVAIKMLWNNYYYISKGVESKTEQKLDPGERIENKEVSVDEYIKMIKQMTTFAPKLFYKIIMNEGEEKLKDMISNPEKYFEEVKLKKT